MGRIRVAAAAVAAAVAGGAGALALTAGSASAAQPPPPSGPPFVSITNPKQNVVESTSAPTISGTITPDPGAQITSVLIQATSSDGRTTYAFPATPAAAAPGQSTSFSGTPSGSSSLAWNGPYQVVATATENDPGGSHTGTSPSVDFAEDAKPTMPTGVSASKDAGGVTVSWQANPEPDILGYLVQRASLNGSDWSTVSPNPWVTGTSYHDTGVQPGSDYQYRVIAVRAGAQPGQTISSDSSLATSTVGPPVGALFGPGGSIGGLPSAIQAITDPVAGLVHPGQGPGGPVTGSPTAGGYGNLPYGANGASLAEPGTPGAQDPKGRSASANLLRTSMFVAAALILLAIAAHLIRMRKALDDSLEPVGVDSWDRHAAGADATAEVATVGTDQRGSDVTRAVAAQRGGSGRSDVTRAMMAQRRR